MTPNPNFRLSPNPQSLERCKAVLKRTGDGRTTHYQKIKEGLFTKPVRIGGRSVAWPSTDVDAIVAARIASKSDGEIRTLVESLEAARADRKGGV